MKSWIPKAVPPLSLSRRARLALERLVRGRPVDLGKLADAILGSKRGKNEFDR